MVTRGEPAGQHEAAEGAADGWERLAPGVVRRRLPHWDATVGAVLGSTGVLVIDTGSGPAEGTRIRTEVRELFGAPVTHVVLTHSHFDHVLGTAAFEGARVYGAVGLDSYLAGAQQELRRDAVRHGLLEAPPGPQAQGEDAATEAGTEAATDAATEATDALVCPRHLVSGELAVSLGDRRVLLAQAGPAHSEYDLAVLVPGTRGGPDVVFCGDLVEESGEPQAGPDARPAGWPAALDRLLSLGGEDALYVPGHGSVVDADFVRAQRDVLARRFAGS